MSEVVSLSLDQAYQVMLKLRQFHDSYEQFSTTGVERINDVDLKSDQKKKIEVAVDTIKSKSKEIAETVANVEETTMGVLRQIDGFNEQEAMRKVDELAGSAKKVKELEVKKQF